MIKIISIIAATLSLSSFHPAIGQDNVSINEEFLLEATERLPWQLKMQRVQRLSKELDLNRKQDDLSYNIQATSYYKTSDEKPLNSFTPITSPIQAFELGVEKKVVTGLKIKAFTFTQQTTNKYSYRETSSGLGLKLTLDLYRDLFGKMTRAQLNKSLLEKQRGILSEKIAQKSFLVNIRKVYWAMITNLEKQKITKLLLKSSIHQAKEARRRQRSKIADKGEVARYRSQTAARKSSLTFLKYQYEKYAQTLKELLPELEGKNILIAKYDLESTIDKVLKCAIVIGNEASLPVKYTSYDEILKILNDEVLEEKIIADSSYSADIFLNTELKKIGKGRSYSASSDDYSDDGRNSGEISLNVNIPITPAKKDSSTLQYKMHKNRVRAEYEQINSRLDAMHFQTVKYVTLLNQAISEQKENNTQLTVTMKQTQKKYNQARISVRDLINDQDALFGSSLDELNTKLTVISTILDYFSVFTETPCALNI